MVDRPPFRADHVGSYLRPARLTAARDAFFAGRIEPEDLRAVEDECRAGLVSCVKVTTMPVARAFYLVTNRERSRSPLALAFLTFLESQFPAAAS